MDLVQNNDQFNATSVRAGENVIRRNSSRAHAPPYVTIERDQQVNDEKRNVRYLSAATGWMVVQVHSLKRGLGRQPGFQKRKSAIFCFKHFFF